MYFPLVLNSSLVFNKVLQFKKILNLKEFKSFQFEPVEKLARNSSKLLKDSNFIIINMYEEYTN